MKIGLCFPGGGAKGARQAGAFRAVYEWFKERKEQPHACAGASVGTLNMLMGIQAFVDEGHSLETMRELWSNMKRSQVCGRIPHIHPWSTGIYSTKAMAKLIDEYVSVPKLRRSPIHFDVRASRWGAGRDPIAWPRDKYFKDTVRASASYPVVFPPVEIASAWASDRGIKRNIPIVDLIEWRCDAIVVLRTSAANTAAQQWGKPRAPRWHEQLGMLASELMETQTEWQIEAVERVNAQIHAGDEKGKRPISVIQIEPPTVPDIGVLEFDAKKCEQAYWATYRAAQHQLAPLTAIYRPAA